jgi:sugar/nucleoside kinase (ribokinase family)
MRSKTPLLTIVGDVGVDLVLGPIGDWPRMGTETVVEKSELRAGGSGGNAALAAHYLGAEVRLLSLVGDDDFGAWLSREFGALHVSLPACRAPTSMSIGFIHACRERTFFTTRGHLEHLSYDHVRTHLAPARNPGSILLLSGVFLTPELRKSYARLIDEVLELGYQLALDTGWPPDNWNQAMRSEVGEWIGRCHHVLLNELEVASLAGREDIEVAIEEVSGLLPPHASLIIKTGARGAIGIQDGRRCESTAPSISVVDTIGAGDSFNAGYLLARMGGQDLEGALAAGCSAATSIISRFPRREIKRGELAGALAFAEAPLYAQS